MDVFYYQSAISRTIKITLHETWDTKSEPLVVTRVLSPSGMFTTTTPTPTTRTVPRRLGNGSTSHGPSAFTSTTLDTGQVGKCTNTHSGFVRLLLIHLCFFSSLLWKVPERVQRFVRSRRMEGMARFGEEQPLLQLHAVSQRRAREARSAVSTGEDTQHNSVAAQQCKPNVVLIRVTAHFFFCMDCKYGRK